MTCRERVTRLGHDLHAVRTRCDGTVSAAPVAAGTRSAGPGAGRTGVGRGARGGDLAAVVPLIGDATAASQRAAGLALHRETARVGH